MYLAMFGLLIVLLFAMMSMDQPVSNLKYYQVLDYFRNGEVEEYQIDYNDGTLTLKLEGQDQLVDYQLASITQFNQDIQPYIDQYEQTNDTTFKRNYLPAQETSLLVSLLPTLLLLGGMALLWVFMMRQAEHLWQGKAEAAGRRQEGDLCRRGRSRRGEGGAGRGRRIFEGPQKV